MMMVSTCVEFRLLAMPLIPLSHLGRDAEHERKFRLMERVRVAMGERRFSLRTQETYASWIRRYILFHGRRHPSDLDEVDVSAFLSDLVVAASSASCIVSFGDPFGSQPSRVSGTACRVSLIW